MEMIIKFYLLLNQTMPIINKLSKTLGVKITKIGKILSGKNKSLIFDQKGKRNRQ